MPAEPTGQQPAPPRELQEDLGDDVDMAAAAQDVDFRITEVS